MVGLVGDSTHTVSEKEECKVVVLVGLAYMCVDG